MKNIQFKYATLAMIVIFILSAFGTPPVQNYLSDADGDFVMANVKIRIIGDDEYSFTMANVNFYAESSGLKTYNYEVYADSVGLMYAGSDTTYKYVDPIFSNPGINNFTWSFVDLANSENTIQYTTTKDLARVDSFDLSGVNSVSLTTGFSYSHPTVYADSIVYVLGADSLTSVKKTFTGHSSGVSFSSMELTTLHTNPNGAFIILIFNTMPQSYNGKKYYFQNNSTAMVMPLPIN